MTENPLDNCNFVYLDMGTNLGVQIRSTESEIQFLFFNHLWLYRKLYEPHLDPRASVLKKFDQYFGEFQTRDTSKVRSTNFYLFSNKGMVGVGGLPELNPKICNLKVCAVGWEPNPKHVEYLQKMTEAYKSCGYRVVINTRVGVGAHNTKTEFVETRNDGDRDWGASVRDDGVREDGVPLDKVKMSQSPCYSTVMSGTVQSP